MIPIGEKFCLYQRAFVGLPMVAGWRTVHGAILRLEFQIRRLATPSPLEDSLESSETGYSPVVSSRSNVYTKRLLRIVACYITCACLRVITTRRYYSVLW